MGSRLLALAFFCGSAICFSDVVAEITGDAENVEELLTAIQHGAAIRGSTGAAFGDADNRDADGVVGDLGATVPSSRLPAHVASDWHLPDRAKVEEWIADLEADIDPESGRDEEERPPTEEDWAMSVLIFGFIIVLIFIVHLLNSKNHYVSSYTWSLVKTGLDIFLAVGLFVGLCHLLKHAMFGFAQESLHETWLANCILIVVASLALEYMLRRAARCRGDDVEYQPRQAVACKTVGGLFAHVNGFAWMHFWSLVQQHVHKSYPFDKTFPLLAVAIVAFAIHLASLRLWKFVRWMSADDLSTKEAWEEHGSEAEIESGAVHIAFLLMQVLRYRITGLVPTSRGVEPLDFRSNVSEVSYLLLAIFLSQGCMLTIFFIHQLRFRADMSRRSVSWWSYTVYEVVTKTCAFFSGWSMLLAVQWTLQGLFFQYTNHSTPFFICVAMFCTCIAFSLAYALGHLTVRLLRSGRRHRGQAAMNTVASLGLMVGFSWERVFDTSVEVLSYGRGAAFARFVLQRSSDASYRANVAWYTELGRLAFGLLIGVILIVAAETAVFRHISPRVLETVEQRQKLQQFITRARTHSCLSAASESEFEIESNLEL
eukprot:TRINITY_DN22854_c0_g1_i1.p1 TRINITY_DN22854_c0_g1~~TRINITY_DN22854_c0_g1_i1.p1  ORF type:complete len:612 (-),score=122.75 TRINITY_DN22854_c0_g1_i1:93-1886(-)